MEMSSLNQRPFPPQHDGILADSPSVWYSGNIRYLVMEMLVHVHVPVNAQ